MKKIGFYTFLLLTTLMVSCSEEENSTPVNTVDDEEYFEYSANGEVVPIEDWTAIRVEDTFEVLGEAEDGRSIFFKFNAMGDLATVSSTPELESTLPWLYSPYEFTPNYFDFEIVAIDEDDKIIKVNYSGNLYEEEFDLTSASTPAEGTFNVSYTTLTPALANVGVSAKINGTDWYSVKKSTTIFGATATTLDFNSDDAYKISILFDHVSTTTGTYNFTSGSTPQVSLSKYDPATQSYTDYLCTGTITITAKEPFSGMHLLQGTFSFTATNPETNATIQVDNGVFKELYNN